VIELDGCSLTLEKAVRIAYGEKIKISPQAKKRVKAGRDYIRKVACQDASVYGVNTGFGFLANHRISDQDLKKLQYNILKSHASGYGPPLSTEETRLSMALRLNLFLRGVTGVTMELIELLARLLNKEIYPIIPSYGSVGASGDLAPLAHLALPLIGIGDVIYQGKTVSAKTALKKEGVKPHSLQEKEGLGLINGTPIMLAVGAIALYEAKLIIDRSIKICALTYEGMKANLSFLDEEIHRLRGQKGQIDVAKALRQQLSGSKLFGKKMEPLRLQDPYSIRCAPQVIGASMDAVDYAVRITEIELNAATDNPLVFPDKDKVISCGNFHGQPLALAFDFAAMALSEVGNISDRRIELLLNPFMSQLPPFLTPHEGVCSGYMAAQYLASSIVNECKLLANPSSTDSIPGNVGIEDFVSMGMTSARKLKKIQELLGTILAVEWISAAQAVDLRNGGKLGKGSKQTYEGIRSAVPFLDEDRVVAKDVEKAVKQLEEL